MNRIIRPLAVAAGASGLLLATAGAAAAHVTAGPSEVPAGGYTVIGFSLPHGCDGSPTTEIAIQIPEGVTSVKPTVVAGWDIEIGREDLAEPLDDGEGGQITDRVATVTYTADDPLPDEYRQEFPVSMKMPDTAGESMAFPIVQTCVEGETAWITVPKEGDEEPEHPAPVVALAASTGDADGTDEEAATTETEGDGDGTGLAVAALVVGGLGLAAGGTSLAKSRSRT